MCGGRFSYLDGTSGPLQHRDFSGLFAIGLSDDFPRQQVYLSLAGRGYTRGRVRWKSVVAVANSRDFSEYLWRLVPSGLEEIAARFHVYKAEADEHD